MPRAAARTPLVYGRTTAAELPRTTIDKAATTAPRASMGAATETAFSVTCRSLTAMPARRTSARTRRNCRGSVRVPGVGGQRRSQHGLLDVGRRVREQDQPDAGGRQGETAADPGEHADRLPPGDPLDEDDLLAVADGQLHVLVGDLVEVLHERQRRLAQTESAGRQRAELPHP